jgi:hypothetical protein
MCLPHHCGWGSWIARGDAESALLEFRVQAPRYGLWFLLKLSLSGSLSLSLRLGYGAVRQSCDAHVCLVFDE